MMTMLSAWGYQGKDLRLAAGEECDALPLLKDNSGDFPQNNNSKEKESMNADFKAIALKLGLPETATEAEILARIGILQGFQNANEELRRAA